LAAIHLLKAHFGSKVLSVTGYPGSPVSESSDFNVELPWITEESICQTRSFSNLYLAGVMMAAFAGMDDALLGELEPYIRSFEEIASGAERQIKSVVQDLRDYSSLHVLANGILYGVGIEGAYINVEMASFPSWYFGTLEFRHGPIVLVNEKSLVVIISKRNDAEYEQSLADEIRKRGGRVMVISNHAELENADYRFHIQSSRAEVIALYSVFVLQGLAYYKAVGLGLSPDKPKDLVQWISIEVKGNGNPEKEQ
jgi:fructoselysine-6-P-deglycase FrlB-like protein